MEISPTSSAATQAASSSKFADMSSEEFIKVLFTELQNQDPLDPQDSSKLLEQLSSIRNIEGQLSLQQSLKQLVMQNQVASAGNLIGNKVQGLDKLNNKVEGMVSSVRVTNEAIVLELDTGQALPLDRVSNIAKVPTAAE
ncbi:MAG: flagellar hook capping FlgD N-terminal domain-containing protein [Phycisphaeraceae bacterium]